MFTFNGKHDSEVFDKVLSVSRGMTAPSSAILQQIPGGRGAYLYGTETDIMEFEIEVLFVGDNRQDLWKRIRQANAWLRTKETKKLSFDDEPDFYYNAICVDAIDLDEVLEYGIATIRFISPEPDAFGLTKEQKVDSADAIFIRPGIRYREDGTQVTENYPYFQTGKYGEAALVEEGTTNLLTTAAAPASEEVTVTTGSDYYLSTVDGSATVEHKKTETLTKTTLSKEGTDFSKLDTLTTDFTGTASNVDVSNDEIKLKLTGESLTYSYDSQTLRPITPEIEDDCSTLNTWTVEGTAPVSDGSKITIDVPTADTVNNGVAKTHSDTFPSTVIFYGTVSGNCNLWFADGNNYCRIVDTPTVTENSWYYVRFIAPDSAEVYVNGVLQTGYTVETGTSAQTNISFYVDDTKTGTYNLENVCISYADQGVPPEDGVYTLSYSDFSARELGTVGVLYDSSITWTQTMHTVDGSGDPHVRVDRGETQSDGTISWAGFVDAVSGQPVPHFNSGDDLSINNTRVDVEFVFTTTDPCGYLTVDDVELNFQSSYYTSGTYTSPLIDVSTVGKAATSSIDWSGPSLPPGTGLTVDVSVNGGDFQEAADGVSIPGIDQTTALSTVQYRVNLSSDGANTPTCDEVSLNLVSGYVPSETETLTGVDVSSIGMASTSLVELPSVSGDASTSVTFEYSTDGTTWASMTDGQPFISNEDLSGKTLDVRYTLSTTDTNFTPTVGNTLTWYIMQQEQNTVIPATSVIRVTPSTVSRWQLEAKTYPTGWNGYGTRDAEQLKLHIGGITSDWESEGGVSVWAYEDGSVKQPNPTVIDTTGVESRIRVFQDESNGNYILEVGGQGNSVTGQGSVGWKHFVLTWDSSNIYFYLNGTLQHTLDRTTSPLSFEGMEYLWLGVDRDGGNHWNSLVDDIALFQRLITPDEVTALFNGPASAEDEDTAVYALDGDLKATSDDVIRYEGTAPGYPKFTVEFVRSSSSFRVSNGADFVLVSHEFNTGDTLYIDCETEEILINGALSMNALSLESDFFAIEDGDQVIIEPDGIANVNVEFTEKWV